MPEKPRRATKHRWNWRAALTVACMLQIVGISWAVILVAISIESTSVTGPILGLLAVFVAIGSSFSRSVYGVVFGLSTLATGSGCVMWIMALSWSPHEAQSPITATLISYQLLAVPIGCLAIYHTLTPLRRGTPRAVRRGQFSIAQLLAVTTWAAVAMAIGKAAADCPREVQIVIATALCPATILGLAIAVKKGLTVGEEADEPDAATSSVP